MLKNKKINHCLLLILAFAIIPSLTQAQGQERALNGFINIILLIIGSGTLLAIYYFLTFYAHRKPKDKSKAVALGWIFGILGGLVLLAGREQASTFGEGNLSNRFIVFGFISLAFNGLNILVSSFLKSSIKTPNWLQSLEKAQMAKKSGELHEAIKFYREAINLLKNGFGYLKGEQAFLRDKRVIEMEHKVKELEDLSKNINS